MSAYACSDFHGMMNFYKAIKDKLNPEDRVYFLGDAGDRGPEPWELIKTVLNDPQFIYIKGNHEDMLVNALEEFVEEGYVGYRNAQLLYRNGGDPTITQATAEAHPDMWLRKLKNLPIIQEYVNTQGQKVVLSHAGFTPWLNDDGTGYELPWMSHHELIWNRDHFFDEWDEKKHADVYIIHGHTPIPYLLDDIDPMGKIQDIKPGVLWYDNHRKCCVDCGAVFTGICALLNLDTWEQEIFQSEAYL